MKTSPRCAAGRGARACLAALLALGTVALAACGPGASDDRTTPTPEQTMPASEPGSRPTPDGAIRIAAVFPTEGRYQSSGRDSLAGVALAVDAINAAGGIGGRRLHLVDYETRSDVETTRRAALRAVDEGAVAIVGSNASLLSDAIARVVEPRGVVMISNVSTATDLTHGRRFVFRVCYSNDHLARLLARFVWQRLGLRRVAILEEVSRPYSRDLGASFARHFSALATGDDGAVRTWRYSARAPDLTPQLDAIRAFRPDGLFMPTSFDDATLAAILLDRLGLAVTMIGGDSWTNDQLFARGRPSRPAYHSDHWSPAPDDAFVASFRARFGRAPQGGRAALAHDAVQAIAAALAALGPVDDVTAATLAPRLRDALMSVSFRGVTGDVRFDDNGDAQKPCFVFRVDANGRTPFATIE